VIVLVERTNALDERLCECFVDPPVPLLVCIAECGKFDETRETQMMQFFRMCIDTENDAACTFAECQLSEGETEKLLPAGKRFHGTITTEFLDALLEDMAGERTGDLLKNVAAGVHRKKRKCCLIFRFPFEMSKKNFGHFFSQASHISSFFVRLTGHH
jgi:hypothetical protein